MLGFVGCGIGDVLVALVVVLDDEVEVEVEVDVEVEVEEEVLDEEPVVEDPVVVVSVVVVLVVGVSVVVVLLVVGVVLLLVLVVDGQVSLHEATTPVIGSFMSVSGVPGGKLTLLKVSTWPSTNVTVTVHASARALGSVPIAIAIRSAAVTARTVHGFRLLSTIARLLQNHVGPARSFASSQPRRTGSY